jgi:hypothetical protein
MSQVTHGSLIGAPGGAGSPSIGFFYGSGSPTSQSDVLITNAQVGSLYSDYVGSNLWFKATSGWTQITIP